MENTVQIKSSDWILHERDTTKMQLFTWSDDFSCLNEMIRGTKRERRTNAALMTSVGRKQQCASGNDMLESEGDQRTPAMKIHTKAEFSFL